MIVPTVQIGNPVFDISGENPNAMPVANGNEGSMYTVEQVLSQAIVSYRILYSQRL